MIDSDFIIQYTNGLYSTPAESAPRYDEFRDMFSSGQIRSKEWVIKELLNTGINPNKILVVGSWFGTLGLMCNRVFPDTEVKLLDIDPRCSIFLKNIIYNLKNITSITGDMYMYQYTEDLVINTSCEHILDIKEWLSVIPPGTTVVLQSNNFFKGNGHVNCAESKTAFIEKLSLSNVLYSGEIVFPMYSRYMVIGQV